MLRKSALSKMKNLELIMQFICLYLLEFCVSNHLKNQHIDITQASGVEVEADANSQVSLSGIRFPKNSFEEGDRLSLQFRTSARNGLILHAESAHRKHELTVFIYEGKPRLRISGRCHWLYTRDVAFDDYNVSDNTFHTLIIVVKSTGVSFTIDHRDERSFFYASNPTFRCWHVQKFFFGQPSPNRIGHTTQPEYGMRMDGCIRYFTTQRTNGTDLELSTSYKRVSSCQNLL